MELLANISRIPTENRACERRPTFLLITVLL